MDLTINLEPWAAAVLFLVIAWAVGVTAFAFVEK
jgi:hypothetical protein